MRPVMLMVALLTLALGESQAQSLSPMENEGPTPTAVKGFKLLVGNPYPDRMRFRVTATDPDFKNDVVDVEIKPDRLVLAPGAGRSVIVAFKIDSSRKERTIGVCVVPEDITGPILPRVCGRYTGHMR